MRGRVLGWGIVMGLGLLFGGRAPAQTFPVASPFAEDAGVREWRANGRLALTTGVEQFAIPVAGKVTKVDWTQNAVFFQPDAHSALPAASRPVINLNPAKWLTAGAVLIVPPDDWNGMTLADPRRNVAQAAEFTANGIDLASVPLVDRENGETRTLLTTWDGKPVRQLRFTYNGRAYPSLFYGEINHLGGRIIGSADCGWTKDVVGRYFVVAEDGEFQTYRDKDLFGNPVPSVNGYRWYRISDFTRFDNGTCTIRIERPRQSVWPAGAPMLYNAEHYTWDGHERPLRYIIAPGAVVTRSQENYAPGTPLALTLMAGAERNTAFDFAPGDPITQATDVDAAVPIALAVRQFMLLPSAAPVGAIDINNYGMVAGYAGLHIGYDGPSDRYFRYFAAQHSPQAGYQNGIVIDAATGAGIRFGADVSEGALVFEQPFRPQTLKWYHAKGVTTLSVSPQTGDMTITGGGIALPALKRVDGVSATNTIARNLRGINMPVPPKTTQMWIYFATPEADGKYAINVEPNWNTTDWVVIKARKGFLVKFGAPAPKGALIDWMLLR